MTEESSEEGAQARARERRLHLHYCSPTSNGSIQYRQAIWAVLEVYNTVRSIQYRHAIWAVLEVLKRRHALI